MFGQSIVRRSAVAVDAMMGEGGLANEAVILQLSEPARYAVPLAVRAELVLCASVERKTVP
jgi:hypothetical protein